MKNNTDQIVKKNTGFENMDAMINARGGFFPSLRVSDKEIRVIADEYDSLQAARGDNRRALRYAV